MDTRKWLVSKARPKIYGDKLEGNAARNLGPAFDISDLNSPRCRKPQERADFDSILDSNWTPRRAQ